MFAELDVEITIQEIVKAIKELKTGKSGSPDRILNEFLINGIDVLPKYLHKLFNILLVKGYFHQFGVKVILYRFIKKETFTMLIITGVLPY